MNWILELIFRGIAWLGFYAKGAKDQAVKDDKATTEKIDEAVKARETVKTELGAVPDAERERLRTKWSRSNVKPGPGSKT